MINILVAWILQVLAELLWEQLMKRYMNIDSME